MHTPAHAPEMHAWVVQGVVAPQVPSAPHTCTALPEHCVPASEQRPEQRPAVQAWLAHACAALQEPSAVHVCTPVPAH